MSKNFGILQKATTLYVLSGGGPINVEKDCKNKNVCLSLVPVQLTFDFGNEELIQRRDKKVVSVTGFNKRARYHLDGAAMYFIGFDHDIPGYKTHRRAFNKMIDRMAEDGIQFLGEVILTPPDRILEYLEGNTLAFNALQQALARVDITFADAIPHWSPPKGDPDDEPYLR